MSIVTEAIFEDGVLKPTEPLPLKEHGRVRITVESDISLAEQTAGLIGWRGDAESFERILAEAEHSELSP